LTIVLAMILDALCGEPKWLWSRVPHPAIIMGKAVGYIDTKFNNSSRQKLSGAMSFAGLVLAAFLIGLLITAIPGIWADVILGAMLLAQKSLVDHVQAVGNGLRMSLTQGRRAVAMIVSRDTQTLDKSAVARSAIESGSENFSDGVIAPIFWFALLGIPGLLVYKITNTADSMIGYKTERHRDFGWAAARFDDLLNWVPARITALLIWLTDRQTPSAKITTDAALHRSPNAGWPEAAMAYKLNIALAGPRSYDGIMTSFPYVNDAGEKTLGPADIDATTRTLWTAWWITLAVMLSIALI
jgi:adenosylcobinamide-phosphate synthase